MSRKVEQLNLPEELPVAEDFRRLAETGRAQRNWWYDLRRALQEAIEGLRRERGRFETSVAAGSITATLGTTALVSGTTPYVWVEVVAPDGTICVMPMWKKG